MAKRSPRRIFTEEERALPELRKHLSWYIHGLPGSAAARAEINKATTGQELYSLLARVFLPQ